MVQEQHFEATRTPQDITAGRSDGCYVGQAIEGEVIYATAASAPSDWRDYFRCDEGESFAFTVGGGALPTWVRMGPDFVEFPMHSNTTLAVALARI